MPVRQSVKRPWMPERKAVVAQSGRKVENRHIYGSTRWKIVSANWRKRNPLCVDCLDRNVLTDCSPGLKSGVTDHIVPINKGGDPWDEGNFATLCNRCHNSKSAKDK